MAFRSFELGGLVALVVAAYVLPSCGKKDEHPAPAGFVPSSGGTSASGGTQGKGGKGGAGKGGGGTGGRGQGGESGDGSPSGMSGDGPLAGDTGDGGRNEGGAGNNGHAAEGGVGNRGASGGGGNETAEGGALLGPDPALDCPEVKPEPAAMPPVCDPKAKWADGDLVLPNPDGLDLLLSITPDELSIAWKLNVPEAPSFWYADRVNVGDDFGEPEGVVGSGAMQPTQIALSPGRLRLIAVVGGSFVEFVRPTTAEAFVFAGNGYFAAIDNDAGARALALGDPVVSADESTLYYSLTGQGVTGPTLYVSKRSGAGDWPVGTPLDECDLNGSRGSARRPRAIASDGRTLFYYDEVRGNERAAWRSAPDQPFDTFVDYTMYQSVQPNFACDRLYYSQSNDGGALEIYSADRE